MQLAGALAVLADIQACAESESLDAGLRLAWVGHRAAEARAADAGDYARAQYHKHQCNCMAAMMRMYARAATIKPIVIGGVEEDADVENAMGRAIWHRPPTGGQ